MSDAEYTGPLNFAVFVIPRAADLADIATEIRQLATGHRTEILDIELISRTPDGAARLEPLPAELDAAETDLLHTDDLAAIADDLADGELALVVVYEDRTLAGLAARVTAASGRELWAGGIDAADIDDTDADAADADAASENEN